MKLFQGTKHGELRCYWGDFFVPVQTLIEGKLVLDTLAQYDLFNLKDEPKPDYPRNGGLYVFDTTDTSESNSGSWIEWTDGETGESIDWFELEQVRAWKE